MKRRSFLHGALKLLGGAALLTRLPVTPKKYMGVWPETVPVHPDMQETVHDVIYGTTNYRPMTFEEWRGKEFWELIEADTKDIYFNGFGK